jgi:hypothetical protein
MKIIRVIALFVCLCSAPGFAQSLSRVTSGIDVGLGYLDKQWAPAAMYHQELSLNHFEWFRIGWGVRAWGFYTGRTDLLPQTSAISDDTLKFGRISANGASFLIGANIRLWKVDIGANTDLFGIAFGLKRRGLYTKSSLYEGEGAGYYNAYVRSNPSTFNALPLFLDKQGGQSEVFARFWITDRIGLKLGYLCGRTTYSSEVKLDNGHRRFSKTYGLPFASIAFPMYN